MDAMEGHESIDLARQRLNLETGRITWEALQRHFARGVLYKVEPGTDLVEVAARIAEDDRDRVSRWLAEGVLARATDDDATGWLARGAEFWAVVLAPWVLVQEIRRDGV
jgi:hypothetical protein